MCMLHACMNMIESVCIYRKYDHLIGVMFFYFPLSSAFSKEKHVMFGSVFVTLNQIVGHTMEPNQIVQYRVKPIKWLDTWSPGLGLSEC